MVVNFTIADACSLYLLEIFNWHAPCIVDCITHRG